MNCLNDLLIGSPSYPSPLDRIRTGKRERAAQFGLDIKNEESFEANQSFPRTQTGKNKFACDLSPLNANKISALNSDISKINDNNNVTNKDIMNKFFNNNQLNSISFLPTIKKNFKKFDKLQYKRNNSLFQTTNTTLGTSIASSSFNQRNNANESATSIANELDNSNAFDRSWQFYNYFANSDAILAQNSVITCGLQDISTNPNKALVTINGRNSEILTANNIACELFDYREDEIIGMKLKDLLHVNCHHKHDVLMESHLDNSGNLVLCSGKLFDAIDSNGIIIPISITMQKLQSDHNEPKCLCIIEPVKRVTGTFSVNVKGRIRNFDDKFSSIFGYVNQKTLLNGKDISELIPKLRLPMCGITNEIRKQTLTGRTINDTTIPLTIKFLNKQLFNNEEIVYNCKLNFYTNISGLITIRASDGVINSYNSIFTRILFGYDDDILKNKPINVLIPNFYETNSNRNTPNIQKKIINDEYENVNGGDDDDDDKCIDENLNRMLYDDELSIDENVKRMKYSSCISTNNDNEERSFNSNSIDSSNLSMKTAEFTFNTNYTGARIEIVGGEGSSMCNDVSGSELVELNGDYNDDDDDDDDDCSTIKHCYNCGVELKYKRQSDFILNDIIESNQTPQYKCNNFILKQNFSSYCGNDDSIVSSKASNSITNTPTSVGNLTFDNVSSSKLNVSNYENKYICEACIDKINSGKTILPLKEVKINEQDIDSNNSNNNNDDDTNADVDDDVLDHEDIEISSQDNNNNTTDGDDTDVSLVASDENILNTNENIIPVIKITQVNDLNDSIAKKNFLKTKLNLLRMSEQQQQQQQQKSMNNSVNNTNSGKTQVTSTPAPNEDRLSVKVQTSTGGGSNKNDCKVNGVSTTTTKMSTRGITQLNEGTFYGYGKHKDGSLIKIIYQRRFVDLSSCNNNNLICIWICKDPDTDKSMIDNNLSLDQSQHRRSYYHENSILTTGTFNNNQYSNEYEDILTLGRGASGFVQYAKRKQDSFEVVTKYIRKTKIHKDNWIEDDRYGHVPLEISILCKLDHSNIIKVIEVFQDVDYIQMVMEKHGCGMDLFEFIDRQPLIDEPLASYIFRQLVSALSYLHSNNIVHRDIKDENIVINERFHIKLIDFGSAAYMQKGKKFATFCGTLDYCSPEVLLGNKYYGPELDCWTIGIALYTLVFAENPFFDADETIECILKPPFKVSKELMKLLFSILYPKPELRATIKDIENNEWVTQYVDIDKYKWEHVIKNTVFNGNNAGDCRFGDSETNEIELVKANNNQQNKPQQQQQEMLNLPLNNPKKQVSNTLKPTLAVSDLHSKSF